MIVKSSEIERVMYGDMPVEAIYQGSEKIWPYPCLPNGYTLLNYLESTGTQLIDTRWRPTSGIFEYAVEFESTKSQGGVSLMGARSNTPDVRRSGTFYFSATDKAGIYIGQTSNIFQLPEANTYVPGTRYFLGLKIDEPTQTAKVKIYDEQKIVNVDNSAKFTGSTKITNTHTFFNATAEASMGERGSFRIYNYRIWEEGYLARSFVPCLDANGKPCMYCLVTKKTYYNAFNSTDFLYG